MHPEILYDAEAEDLEKNYKGGSLEGRAIQGVREASLSNLVRKYCVKEFKLSHGACLLFSTNLLNAYYVCGVLLGA